MMKTYECTVIGRTCIDYIALLEKYPQQNTKQPILDYKICVGGQAANSAMVLAKLGVRTLLVTPIGDDYHGKLAKNILFNTKKLDILISQKNIKTPVAFIWVNKENAERTIVFEKIKSNTLYKKEVLNRAIKSSKYLLFDHQSSRDLYKAVDVISKYKLKIMIDAERDDIYMWKMMKYITYFVCSKEFVKSLKTNVNKLLRKIIKLGPEIVCCTLGEKGAVALVKGSNKLYYSKALKLVPVDTTGAGDVFHAGFMYGVINNWTIQDILSFANRIAGVSTSFIGGTTFLDKYGLKALMKFQ